MKPDGLICGHDYVTGNMAGLAMYGVINAVKEFCVSHNWELVYLTADASPSFAIRKIK